MGHEQFQERLDFVRKTIAGFGLEATDIVPVEYAEDSPFEYNNFIYKITLSNPATPSSFTNAGFYTTPPPETGVSTLIMRLANPKAEGIVQTNRVENEVAAIYLARQGLLASKPEAAGLVPDLYAWHSSGDVENEFKWTLMEFKEGEPLDRKFQQLGEDDRRNLLRQIADVFAGIQGAPVPESVESHGGLTIDAEGKIVSGQMTILKGGPWDEYGSFLRARLTAGLREADESPVLEGWRLNGVRERIDAFLEKESFEKFLAGSGVDVGKRVLIHGDLTSNNTQFDPETNKLTGVLDFDWAFVSHPCHEFFSSFGDIGGNLGGGTMRDPDLSGGRLGKAMIDGNFDIPDLPEEAAGQLRRAKFWDDALKERGALRPSDLAGIAALDQLRRLEGLLGPFALVHPVMLKRKTAEEISEARKQGEAEVIACLDALGA